MSSKTSSSTKSKELKIITRYVVTLKDVEKDPRKIKLLHIIKSYGEISEKALQYLVYHLAKDKGIDLGYKFLVIGNVPSSKELKEDMVALLYVGLIETNPKNKKLRITGLGKELLEKVSIPKEEADRIASAIEELRSRIQSIDAEVEMTIRELARMMRRRRRRLI